MLDTLVLARKKHPGQRNSLDALCKRYDVDNSNRQHHGALLDAEILAFVYLAMTGGQTMLFVDDEAPGANVLTSATHSNKHLTSNSPVYIASDEEMSKHNDFIQFLVKKSGVNRWND